MADQRMEVEERARRMNEKLAQHVFRRIVRHAVLGAALLVGAGIAVYFATSTPSRVDHHLLLAFCGLIGFLICGLFALEAHGHWREIKGRRWVRLTPRFGRRAAGSPPPKAEESAPTP